MVQDRGWASHGRWISRGRGTYSMFVTRLTSHEPMSWLNAAAPSNMFLYANTHHSDRAPNVYREAGEQASGTYRREKRVHYMAAVHGYGGGWYGSRA